MAKESKTYRFVGIHADSLASGRPLEPGEFVELTSDEVKDNKPAIDDGQLVAIKDSDKGDS